MAVPKKKKSHSRTRQGRAHHALSTTNWIEDSNTGEPVRPHHIDLKTGMYKGRKVLETKESA